MHKVAILVFLFALGCSRNGNGRGSEQPEGMSAGTARSGPSNAPMTPGEKLGDVGLVDFPTSCNLKAQEHMSRGVALLHHMTYAIAKQEFQSAREADSGCVMALWGSAMTGIHPLWPDRPTAQQLEEGWKLVQIAMTQPISEPREVAYLATVEAYYRNGSYRDEAARLAEFRAAWKALSEAYPDDQEAAALFALAHLATADPNDRSYRVQREAGAMAEAVLAKNPLHPGAHHYIIHAYDVPELAPMALEVARSYGELAPNIPHALHMPSHIFVRLGLWRESIEWNQRSAAAALQTRVDGAISLHYLHALDYLAYANLQIADDDEVVDLMRELALIEGPMQHHEATAYSLAAIPARYALERHAWQEAAALEARQPSSFSWSTVPEYEAITHYARALGAAMINDGPTARDALNELDSLQLRASQHSMYWSTQVQIQKMTAEAWLSFMRGNRMQGLRLMRRAAALEGSTLKSPITPGEILPASELLGDMLLALGRGREALRAYETSLQRSPRRFNSLYGAGKAAEMSGDMERARAHYGGLIEMAVKDATRDELTHARFFMKNGNAQVLNKRRRRARR